MVLNFGSAAQSALWLWRHSFLSESFSHSVVADTYNLEDPSQVMALREQLMDAFFDYSYGKYSYSIGP